MKDKFTIEEMEILDSIKDPCIRFSSMKLILDNHAKELGYESHEDFLIKTGWIKRFIKDE